MQKNWTEAKVAKLIAEGYGSGSGASYKPWIEVRDISSTGRKHLVPQTRFGREVHLLSDIEYSMFLLLEWSDDVVDVNEQYPLDRDVTMGVAGKLGIRHPCYRGTNVPAVMSVDFMVTSVRDEKTVIAAFNTKPDSATEDERELLKLEIARSALELMEVPHHVIVESSLPHQKVFNLDWLQQARVKPGEVEPAPGYFDEMASRFRRHGAAASHHKTLGQVCSEFDRMHSAEPGTALRVARILMQRKEVLFNLEVPHPAEAKMSAFEFRGQSEPRVVAGGN